MTEAQDILNAKKHIILKRKAYESLQSMHARQQGILNIADLYLMSNMECDEQ